jgi:RNA polymerase sigma-70 factor, ECF subfamily
VVTTTVSKDATAIDVAGIAAREEAALLAEVAAGDLGTPLAELYRRYASRLYGFGLKLLGDAGLAEELVQECFVRLWRTAGRFDAGKASVGTYLFTIARSLAVDLRRRPSSRPFDPEPAQEIASKDEDSVDRLMEGLAVRDALDSLSPAHQAVLRLAYEHGLTQNEIAVRLGIPLGTVKTRAFHGLRALRLALQERGIDA